VIAKAVSKAIEASIVMPRRRIKAALAIDMGDLRNFAIALVQIL
jgi:hypothetical protein